MTNETVRDVCAEMCCCDQKYYNLSTPYQVKVTHNIAVLLRQFADRIDAAAKRENDRLRAALKPVLAVNIEAAIEHGVDCTELFGAIIKDAQNTYKEGGVK